jgi:hypothetical protein
MFCVLYVDVKIEERETTTILFFLVFYIEFLKASCKKLGKKYQKLYLFVFRPCLVEHFVGVSGVQSRAEPPQPLDDLVYSDLTRFITLGSICAGSFPRKSEGCCELEDEEEEALCCCCCCFGVAELLSLELEFSFEEEDEKEEEVEEEEAVCC